MPEPNRLSAGGRASNHIIQQTQFHQGLLPRSEDFEAYERVLHGVAECAERRSHQSNDGHDPRLHHLRRLNVRRGVPPRAQEADTKPRDAHRRARPAFGQRSLRRLHPTQAETTKSTAADAIVIAWRASRGASKGTISGTDRSWRRASRILVVQNRLGYHNGNRAGGCPWFGKSGQRENSGQCRACSNASPLWTKEAHVFTLIMTLLGKWRLLGNGVHHSSLLASYVLRLQVC